MGPFQWRRLRQPNAHCNANSDADSYTHANTNSYGYIHPDSHGNGNGNGNGNGHGNGDIYADTDTYSHSEAYADAQAPAAASPAGGTLIGTLRRELANNFASSPPKVDRLPTPPKQLRRPDLPWLAVALAKAAEDDGELIAKGANIRRQSWRLIQTQRVEDNAFHLAALLHANTESSL